MSQEKYEEKSLDLFLMGEALSKVSALDDEERLNVNLGAFDGPLDVLLLMARKQKVDLLKISISALVDQYLAFIKAAQAIRLELAADYLVMAAWLAFLKSALLLPPPEKTEETISPELLAARLQFQIARLDAFRDVTGQMMKLPQLGEAFFYRGFIEERSDRIKYQYKDTLYDLLMSYGEQRLRNNRKTYHVRPPAVMTVEDAIARLLPKIGKLTEWTSLKSFLPTLDDQTVVMRKSAIAGTFVACLELAKRGLVEIKQDFAYADLNIRGREIQ